MASRTGTIDSPRQSTQRNSSRVQPWDTGRSRRNGARDESGEKVAAGDQSPPRTETETGPETSYNMFVRSVQEAAYRAGLRPSKRQGWKEGWGLALLPLGQGLTVPGRAEMGTWPWAGAGGDPRGSWAWPAGLVVPSWPWQMQNDSSFFKMKHICGSHEFTSVVRMVNSGDDDYLVAVRL